MAGSKFKIAVTGIRAVKAGLKSYDRRVDETLSAALLEEALQIAHDAVQKVGYDTGKLKGSIRLEYYNKLKLFVKAGGSDAWYAKIHQFFNPYMIEDFKPPKKRIRKKVERVRKPK